MNNILTIPAILAMTTTAFASDLPSKKTAPIIPVSATNTDSLTVSYGQDLGVDFGAKTSDTYAVAYKHSLGSGFSVGGVASTSQSTNSLLKQNIEAQASYALPAIAGVVVSGKVGVGERFTTTNFPYFALYGNADYKLLNGVTLNAAQYRYRNAFDTANDYESHQIGTGVTIDLASNYAVSAKISRSYDADYNATGDAVTIGLTVKF